MSAKIAVDLKLFEYLVAKNSPITAAELATLSGAEELLISIFSSHGSLNKIDTKALISASIETSFSIGFSQRGGSADMDPHTSQSSNGDQGDSSWS